MAGKAEWAAMGLPTEGKNSNQPKAGDIVRSNVPTCFLDEQVSDVSGRVKASDNDVFIVVDEDGVVLGRLWQTALTQYPDAVVGDVMEEGPTTIRPNTKLADIIPRMQAKKVNSIIVTLADGRLAGILFRKDGETLLAHETNQ